MQRSFLLIVAWLGFAPGLFAADHGPANIAFDSYVTGVENRLNEQHHSTKNFIPVAATADRLKGGEVVIDKEASARKVPNGMIHDWRGTMLLPQTQAREFLAVVQDPDRFSTYYAPQVVRSSLVRRQGDQQIVSMRLLYHKVISVTLDSQYDVRYGRLDADHGYSLSRSSRIDEVEDAGKANEHSLDPSDDHGFLWRLNTYWTYEDTPEGLLLQCEAVSLTRDIPFGTAWLVGPFVTSIPRESLEFTLTATRNAILARRNRGHAN